MASNGPASRRSILRLAALGGLGLAGGALLAACGAGSTTSGSAGTAAGTASSKASSAATTAAANASTTSSATPVPTAKPVQAGQTLIEFWSSFDESSQNKVGINALNQMISDFQKQNPKVVVQNIHIDYTNQLADKLLTAIAAGQPPNTYYADRFLTATWANKGIFTDLTPYNSKAGITADKYLPFAWNEATWQGKQWVLPFDTDIRMLIVGVDAAQAAGMDPNKPPQNTQELLDWTDKLTKSDANGITQLGYWPTIGNCFHEIWMVNFGGKFYDEQNNKCTANDPNCVDAFTYMQTYAKRWGQDKVDAFFKAQPKEPGQNYLYTGKLVSWVNGDWTLADIKQYKPDFKFTLSPIPGKDGPGSSMAGGWSMTLPKGAKNPDEGFAWISYACGKDGLITYCLGTSHIPTQKEAVADPRLRQDPNHNKFYDQLDKAWNRPVTIEAQTLWNDLGKAQSDVMMLKQEPKNALDFVTQDVNAQYQQDVKK